jgi:hypothetical protein
MSRRKGVKSEQSEQGEMMRAHTDCQKPYERRVSEYLTDAVNKWAREKMICWETYVLSWRSKEVVDGPHIQTRKVVSLMSQKGKRGWRTLGTERKQKSGRGGGCIVTLTGWTHHLHTNTKRKCVSILCIPEASLTHAGQCATNCNGNGGENSPTEERRV